MIHRPRSSSPGPPSTSGTRVWAYVHVLLGAVIGVFTDARWRGVRVLELVDLWTDCEDDAVAGALVTGAWRHAGRTVYELLVLHDYSDQLTRLYRKLGILFTVKDDRRHFIARGTDHLQDVMPMTAYLTGLEGDFAV